MTAQHSNEKRPPRVSSRWPHDFFHDTPQREPQGGCKYTPLPLSVQEVVRATGEAGCRPTN